MKEAKEDFLRIIDNNLKSDNMLTSKSLKTYYRLMNGRKEKFVFYKYCNCDYYTLRNVEKSTLAVKKYTEFNDPYEGIALANSDIDKKDMNIIRNSAMLTCFSEKKNDLLMFAHYADSYKGICIEYDLSLLNDESYYNINGNLVPVIYLKAPVNLKFKDKLRGSIERYKEATKEGKICLDKMDDILSYFLHKASDWKYEREWRLVIPIYEWKRKLGIDITDNKSVAILHNFDCISAIYLGTNIAVDRKQHVIEIVQRLNQSRDSKKKIRVYQTILSTNKYKLVSKKVSLGGTKR